MLCTLIIPILIQCIREKKNSAGLYALIHNVCLVIGMFGGLKGLMHRKKKLGQLRVSMNWQKNTPSSSASRQLHGWLVHAIYLSEVKCLSAL